jgi:hypothetical protein
MNGLLSGQTNYHADEIQEDGKSFADGIARDAVLHADALLRVLAESSR